MGSQEKAVRSGANSVTIRPTLKLKFKLEKFDGNHTEAITQGKDHPACAEILEWELGSKPKVVYVKE